MNDSNGNRYQVQDLLAKELKDLMERKRAKLIFQTGSDISKHTSLSRRVDHKGT